MCLSHFCEKSQHPSAQKSPDPLRDNWCCIVCGLLAGMQASLTVLLRTPKQQDVAGINFLKRLPHFGQSDKALLRLSPFISNTHKMGISNCRINCICYSYEYSFVFLQHLDQDLRGITVNDFGSTPSPFSILFFNSPI